MADLLGIDRLEYKKCAPLRHSREEIFNNFIEELADVKLVLDQVIYLLDMGEEVRSIAMSKIKRTLESTEE